MTRDLMPPAQVQEYAAQLTGLARQLNAFAANLKAQCQSSRSQPKTMRETTAEYWTDWSDGAPLPLFTEDEFEWLQAIPNT